MRWISSTRTGKRRRRQLRNSKKATAEHAENAERRFSLRTLRSLRLLGLRRRALSRLQFSQQLIDFVVALDLCEAVLDVLADHFVLGLADGFVDRDLLLHALEGPNRGPAADRHPRVARVSERAGAAVLRHQHVALRLRFRQLLFELRERLLKRGDLRPPMFDLAVKLRVGSRAALAPRDRGARVGLL